MRGIDVSYANGTIDWSRLRSQINFAILRSSFGSDLPGQTDNCYYHNAEGCIQNGAPGQDTEMPCSSPCTPPGA